MNWPHLHLALNHLPVLGVPFALALLALAEYRRSDDLRRTGWWWLLIIAAVAIPIKFTGDFAYEATADASWMVQSIAIRHEQAADQATTGVFVLALLATCGLVNHIRKQSVPSAVTWATLVVGVITCLLLARAANLGGQIRHEEIRPAVRGNASATCEVSPLASSCIFRLL